MRGSDDVRGANAPEANTDEFREGRYAGGIRYDAGAGDGWGGGRRPGDTRAGGRRRRVRFLLCSLLLAAVVLTHPFTWEAANMIAGLIAPGTDIKAAVATLGEGFSGKRQLTQAIGDAFKAAFRGDGETVSVAGEASDEPE